MPEGSQAEAQPAQGGCRILVADDDPILRELMQAKLSGPETQVVCAPNGVEAWALLARQTFHLAIIDLSMPQLDGFGLISHLRQTPRTIDLPVIVATSRDDSHAVERAYAAGATSFLTKPINWPLLAYQVQFVLRSGAVERELRRARGAADAASRIKDGLFRFLNSELRTPLNVLVGFADVLENQLSGGLKKEQLDHLALMRDASRRLTSVVRDVITYSRLFGNSGDLRMTACDADELLENCAVSFKPLARDRHIKTLVRRLLEPVSIEADPRLMADALSRLAANAARYSPAGGTVELRVGIQEDQSLVFAVRDNGPGIDARRLEETQIFNLATEGSATRPDEGTGLGLPIVRRIAELHGGKLLFTSIPGEGTVAALWLPASRCRPRTLAAAG